jgi:hypothetical protein
VLIERLVSSSSPIFNVHFPCMKLTRVELPGLVYATAQQHIFNLSTRLG